jgi:hypothetical protein
MNSLFSFLFLKRIGIAFFITRRAFRSKVARVPRTTLSTTIPAIHSSSDSSLNNHTLQACKHNKLAIK